MENNKIRNIQLRVPRVKNIIGEIPPLIIRVSNLIILIILGIMFLFVFFVPIPYNIKSNVFVDVVSKSIYVPLHDKRYFKNTLKTSLEIDVFKEINANSIELALIHIGDTLVYNKQLYILTKVEFADYFQYNIIKGDKWLKGKMYIEKESTPLFRRFMYNE
ncbi:MAG: hypothetical protein LBB73_02310 [Dysgonamonadaceae bacterium]|jgi:hypothetical protein|nr:hypothetical protein [Dysgonamonadaceae bacterium]